MGDVLTGCLVFILAFAMECVFVRWTFAAVDGRPWLGGLMSTIIATVSTVGVLFALQGPMFIAANALGHGAGSVLAISWRKRNGTE